MFKIALQKLIQIENRYRRHPIEEMDISWDPSSLSDREFIYVTLNTPRWTPRLPIKSKQTWDPETRKLVHVCNHRNIYRPQTKFGARQCFHRCLSVRRESLYDVTSCLAAWSHDHSRGGVCPGGVCVQGISV